jgi:hypothetical protein
MVNRILYFEPRNITGTRRRERSKKFMTKIIMKDPNGLPVVIDATQIFDTFRRNFGMMIKHTSLVSWRKFGDHLLNQLAIPNAGKTSFGDTLKRMMAQSAQFCAYYPGFFSDEGHYSCCNGSFEASAGCVQYDHESEEDVYSDIFSCVQRCRHCRAIYSTENSNSSLTSYSDVMLAYKRDGVSVVASLSAWLKVNEVVRGNLNTVYAGSFLRAMEDAEDDDEDGFAEVNNEDFTLDCLPLFGNSSGVDRRVLNDINRFLDDKDVSVHKICIS